MNVNGGMYVLHTPRLLRMEDINRNKRSVRRNQIDTNEMEGQSLRQDKIGQLNQKDSGSLDYIIR